MAKFKVGDEVAIAALVKITAIQPNNNDTVSYSTDRGISIHETLLDQIMIKPKEPKAEEPKPAPKPAHRFKVGDRVQYKPHGIGVVKEINDSVMSWIPYWVVFEDHATWLGDDSLSPAPAPEPPKFYTGKVVCVEWKGDVFRHTNAGRIAMIINGISDYAGWNRMSKPFESFSDFCSANNSGVFYEIKE